jgi:phosphoglycolate phosphatase-like HAD superfamily hydrolase
MSGETSRVSSGQNASTVHAVIFDLDGTLVDTNDAHVEAWLAAFRDFGYHVPRERILPEIGKGGDKLVPSILGEDSDEHEGEALREGHGRHFMTIAKDTIFRVFPGTEDLLGELRRRSIGTAVATSSTHSHLNATLASSGLDLERLVGHIVTGGPSLDSKPAPDLIHAALAKLGSDPQRSVMVGDTRHDGEASARAGVPFLGLLCGGRPPEELSRAGALSLYADPADLLARLQEALRLASSVSR